VNLLDEVSLLPAGRAAASRRVGGGPGTRVRRPDAIL